MTTYTHFGPDRPFRDLPPDFQAALTASSQGKSTADTDAVVGSALAGYGYCDDPTYRTMTYCACVNAPIANPECVFAPCTNAPNAYMTVEMQRTAAAGEKRCPASVNCTQIIQMGGNHNVSSNIGQTQNCGGVVQTFITNVSSHPVVTVVAFVLIIAIVMFALSFRGGDAGGDAGPLPPPAAAMAAIGY